MPSNEVEVSARTSATASAVWDLLADPLSFAAWVSGTRRIRSADVDWPAVGTSLWHQWGPWPLRLRDRTDVLECRPLRRLALRAWVRPLAVVRATIDLAEDAGGTRVVLCERVERGIATALPVVTRAVQRWRNRRSLEALLALAGDARTAVDP